MWWTRRGDSEEGEAKGGEDREGGAEQVASHRCPPPLSDNLYCAARRSMVEQQIRARGIRDERVLQTLGAVPRHEFVPDRWAGDAYSDSPLPIGEGQTISQPYIVALMTELLELTGIERVLEIGTGSGYQTVVLSRLAGAVFTIEIIEALREPALERVSRFGRGNVVGRCCDGYQGWPEEAPFDRVVVTAAPEHIPEPLVDQLRRGGRMVIPIGGGRQELMLLLRHADGSIERISIAPVLFVPMTGRARVALRGNIP